MAQDERKSALFWIDLEMTGLDENVHHILEVAVVITDLNFKKLKEYEAVVFQPPEVLKLMDEWCTKTHGENGLTAKVATGKPIGQVEKEVLELADGVFRKDEKIVLAGNSVGNDARFINKYMPKIAEKLHYRIIDVSSFKEIFKDKYNVEFEKGDTHRALQDIYESINELKTYLGHVKIN